MDKPMSGLGFRMMALVFRVRDFLRPRMDLLEEAGIQLNSWMPVEDPVFSGDQVRHDVKTLDSQEMIIK